MSIFERKNGKIVIPRSMYIKILILLTLVGVSSIALKPVQVVINEGITGIRTNLIGRLETLTGMEIRYSSIRPSFFSSLDIRNLRFYKGENEVLNISRTRFHFSLREMIFRKKIIIHTIQIDRPVLNLDMERDKDTFELFKSYSNPNKPNREILQQIAEFLPEKTDYRIRNLLFTLTDGESNYRIDRMNVNITRDGNDINLDANFGAEIKYAGFLDRTFVINTGLGIKGKYLTDLEEGSAEIAVSSLVCNEQNAKKKTESFFRLASAEKSDSGKLFDIKPVTLNFSYKDKMASLFSSEENKSGFFVNYDTQTGRVLSEINFDNFIPGSIAGLSGSIKNFGFLLDMAMNGKLALEYKNKEDIDYSVVLRGGNSAEYNLDGFLINAYGNMKHVAVNNLVLNFSDNASSNTAKKNIFHGTVGFSGSARFAPFRPAGIVSVDHLSFSGSESINGIFNISSQGRDISVSGEKFTIGSFSTKSFDVYLYPSDRDMDIVFSAVCSDDGAVYLDANLSNNPGYLEALLVFDTFYLENIAEILRPFISFINIPTFGFLNNIYMDTEIFISSDYNNLVYNAPEIVLSKNGTIGTLSLYGTDRNFSLRESVFYIGHNELSLLANANFSSTSDIDFSVKADYLDVSWNIDGQLLDRSTLIIRDPNGLHIYFDKSRSGVISGFMEGVNFPVPANIYPAYLDFYITMRYNTPDLWFFDIANLSIRDLYSRNGMLGFSVSGSGDQDRASFRDILYSDSIGELAGSADFFWNNDFSFLHFITSVTDGNTDGETYSLEGMLRNKKIDIDASVSGMRVDRFIKGLGVMRASADAKISWNSIDSFSSQINLSSFSARHRTKPIQASFGASLSNNELVVDNLKFDYANVKTVFPALYMKASEGTAKISTDVQGLAGEKVVEGKINLEAAFHQMDSWMEIGQILQAFKGTLRIEDFQFGELSQDSVVFNFSGDEGAISLYGGPKNMLRLEMDSMGNFFASLSDPLPIRGSFSGTFNRGYFDVYCNDYYVDIVSLLAVASNPQDNFNVNGGYINGKMNLRGPVWNPEFFGTGVCTSLRLQVHDFITEEIRPVPFNILAEGYEMTFGPVTAVSGGGVADMNGWARFEFWAPKNSGLSIVIPAETPVPYSINIAGFHANGNSSGKLELELNSTDRQVEIKGDLYVNNTEIEHNFDEAEAYAETLDSDNVFSTVVDLTITSGSTVEFFWPSINSPILRVNPEMRTVFRVSSDTTSGHFSIISDINFRSGELYYLDRTFYIRRGNLTLRENERQFDPRLRGVRAEIRDRSDSGPVTIAMIIDDQPLLNFVPRFEATPGLTQLEIYTLLGQNQIQGGENTDAQRFLLTSSTDLMAQIVSGSDVLAQMNLVRQFERRARNFLKLDMLSIRTRIIQNAVVSGATMFGVTPVDRMSRVGNYFDNTTVFIGKYVGRDMFIQGTFALKFDENSVDFGGLRLEPDIGFELQNPFFNIRWDFFPYHPENWWLNDNSITLIWSKSF